MATTTPNRTTDRQYSTVGTAAHAHDRYDQVHLKGSVVLLYDRDNKGGWMISDTSVDLDRVI